jgi:sterol desaturase/sphingolipid hydroxylase (fatty acid hydroxylase superfamily)
VRDIVAALVFAVLILPGAALINRYVGYRPVVPDSITNLPLAVRVILYVVIADFGYYWIHRLMHTPYFWRVHKLHHSPTYMYWLADVRGSLLQTVLVNLPYIFTGVSPRWMVIAISLKNIAQNDWMHLNVPWGARWIACSAPTAIPPRSWAS